MLEQALAHGAKPPDAIIVFPDTVAGNEGLKLIKKLPISKKLSAPLHADASEVLDTFRAAGLVSPDITLTAEGVRDLALTIIGHLEVMIKIDGYEERSFPDTSANRLGEQIKRHHTSHAAFVAATASLSRTESGKQPVVQHPRVSMLRTLALDGQTWDSFLSDSVAITCDDDRRGALLNESEYMRKGALEAYLRKQGELASPAAIAALSAGGQVGGSSGAKWSSDQLMEYIMLTIAPQQQTKQSSGGGSNLTRVVINTPDLSGTEEERDMRLHLQHSFSSVENNSAEVATVKQLLALTGTEQGAELLAGVKKTGDNLKRLCTTEMDIEKALQGTRHSLKHAARASERRESRPLITPPALG